MEARQFEKSASNLQTPSFRVQFREMISFGVGYPNLWTFTLPNYHKPWQLGDHKSRFHSEFDQNCQNRSDITPYCYNPIWYPHWFYLPTLKTSPPIQPQHLCQLPHPVGCDLAIGVRLQNGLVFSDFGLARDGEGDQKRWGPGKEMAQELSFELSKHWDWVGVIFWKNIIRKNGGINLGKWSFSEEKLVDFAGFLADWCWLMSWMGWATHSLAMEDILYFVSFQRLLGGLNHICL